MHIYRTPIIIITISFLFQVIIGCVNNSESDTFSQKSHAEWKDYDVHISLPYPKDVIATDSTVVVLGLADNKWVHIYEANSGRLLGHFVSKGDHYNEILNGYTIQILRNGETFIYDISTRSLLQYTKGTKQKEVYCLDSIIRTNGCYMVDDTTIMVDSPVCKDGKWLWRNSFRLVDLKCHKVLSSIDNPVETDTFESSLTKMVSFAPSMNKFAMITCGGGILGAYSISRNNLENIFLNNLLSKESLINGSHKNGNICYGYKDVTTSEEFIYAVFSDDITSEIMSNIGIWSWDGTPIKKIITDKEIIKITIAPDGKRLYGIVYSEDEGFQINYINLN